MMVEPMIQCQKRVDIGAPAISRSNQLAFPYTIPVWSADSKSIDELEVVQQV